MRQLASKIELIDRKAKHEAVVFEHKQAIALENEKIEQQREAKERAYAEELAFKQKKFDLQQAKQQKPTETAGASGDVKMPRLVITKFDGTPQDWMQFWGQFETQIDKSSAQEVIKFSYLKELLTIVYHFSCDLCDADYVGYTARHLHQRIVEHKSSAIGRHFLEAHGNNNLLNENQFRVLRKCQSKFD